MKGAADMKQVLSIAGLDSLAGGGMTADLKTFEEFGVFGHALLTCVVAIKDDLMFHDLPEPVIQAQLDSLRSVVSLANCRGRRSIRLVSCLLLLSFLISFYYKQSVKKKNGQLDVFSSSN